jgi:hypothetical protein
VSVISMGLSIKMSVFAAVMMLPLRRLYEGFWTLELRPGSKWWEMERN